MLGFSLGLFVLDYILVGLVARVRVRVRARVRVEILLKSAMRMDLNFLWEENLTES